MSELETVRFGVPQGSILGTLLFNLYVSDLKENLLPSVASYQYADNTTILTGYHPDELASTARNFLWCSQFYKKEQKKTNIQLSEVLTMITISSIILLYRRLKSITNLMTSKVLLIKPQSKFGMFQSFIGQCFLCVLIYALFCQHST